MMHGDTQLSQGRPISRNSNMRSVGSVAKRRRDNATQARNRGCEIARIWTLESFIVRWPVGNLGLDCWCVIVLLPLLRYHIACFRMAFSVAPTTWVLTPQFGSENLECNDFQKTASIAIHGQLSN